MKKYAERAWIIMGEEASVDKDYKSIIKEHCTPSFTVLNWGDFGFCNGSYPNFTQPNSINADGSVLAGFSPYRDDLRGSLDKAFRWTPTGGMHPLETNTDKRTESSASGISADGAVIVGYVREGAPGESSDRAFRWKEGEGMQFLSAPKNNTSSYAHATSADGSVIVGDVFIEGVRHATRWVRDRVECLGDLNGGKISTVTGVDANGAVIVGYATDGASRGRPDRAFRWEEGKGIQPLSQLRNMVGSRALGVSPNGLVIVGYCNVEEGEQGRMACCWKKEENHFLSVLNEITNSRAVCVSVDGSRIIVEVGYSFLNQRKVFLWEPEKRMKSIEELFSGNGFLLPSLTVRQVNAITPDGTVLVGTGVYKDDEATSKQVAWRAVIPRSDLF